MMGGRTRAVRGRLRVWLSRLLRDSSIDEEDKLQILLQAAATDPRALKEVVNKFSEFEKTKVELEELRQERNSLRREQVNHTVEREISVN